MTISTVVAVGFVIVVVAVFVWMLLSLTTRRTPARKGSRWYGGSSSSGSGWFGGGSSGGDGGYSGGDGGGGGCGGGGE